ncbi:MAG: flagellar export protein FliJ [Planctomycetota bacterium]|jgi:flagellar FliJ protein
MAKAFKYRLEPLLRYRKHLEEEKRRALGQARAAVMEQNRALLDLLRAEEEGKKEFAGMKSAGTLRVGRIRLQEQYLNSLAGQIRRGYETLRVRLLNEEKARRELAEARKKVRVLERLRERQRDRYNYELGRQERKELDEVGLNIFRSKEGVRA